MGLKKCKPFFACLCAIPAFFFQFVKFIDNRKKLFMLSVNALYTDIIVVAPFAFNCH